MAISQPANALPVHMTGNGLSLGIQAVGRIGDEETLYPLAGQMQDVIGWHHRFFPMAKSLGQDWT